MSEGRKCQVALLDERRLDITVQPKLHTSELMDLVASHFNLKEKEYFGLSFIDDTGHQNFLSVDRKVLEHDFPRKSSGAILVLYFSVRYYIESITHLKDSITVELFYLQARQSIFKGQVDVDSDSAFELAAHVLQATHGDFYEDLTTRNQLKKLPVLPTSCLKEHPYIQYCEEKVIEHYKNLEGLTRGAAIVNYMNIVEGLPTYGTHYYEVKDKNNLPWWLGLSYKGISQYDYTDKNTPRKVFPWRQLENLYFREKKFSIEVHDAKRVSVSRRTFGPGNVNVYAWFGLTPQLTKCIWTMAVAQHQFYLDRKMSKAHLPSVRSMSEIANEICISRSSLPGSEGLGSISYSGSMTSLSKISQNSKSELTEEQIEANRAAQKEMFAALKSRKEALEAAVKKKTEELKLICIQEGELTGELPPETPLNSGDPLPVIKKRMGTSFALSEKLFNRESLDEGEELLQKLELDFEIQTKITAAALKLAHNTAGSKSVRKSRKAAYQRAHQKLKDVEKKLNDMREMRGHVKIIHNKALDKSDAQSPAPSPLIQRTQQSGDSKIRILTSPQVEIVEMEQSQGVSLSPSPGPGPGPGPGLGPGPGQGPGIGRPPLSRNSSSPQVSRQYHGSGSSQHGESRADNRGYTSPSHGYSSRQQYRNQMYSGYSSRNYSASSEQSEKQEPVRKNTRYETSMDAHKLPQSGSSPYEYQRPYSHYPASTSGHHGSGGIGSIVRHGSLDNLKNLGKTQDHRRSKESVYSRGSSNTEDEHYRAYKEYHQKLNNNESGAYGRSSPRDANHSNYGSLERRRHNYYEGKKGSFDINQQLTPSKFGCKRDSHSEFGNNFTGSSDKTYSNTYIDTDSHIHSGRYTERPQPPGGGRRDLYQPGLGGPPPPYRQSSKESINSSGRDYNYSGSSRDNRDLKHYNVSRGQSESRDTIVSEVRSRHHSADNVLDEPKPKYFPQTDRSQPQIIVQSPERSRVQIKSQTELKQSGSRSSSQSDIRSNYGDSRTDLPVGQDELKSKSAYSGRNPQFRQENSRSETDVYKPRDRNIPSNLQGDKQRSHAVESNNSIPFIDQSGQEVEPTSPWYDTSGSSATNSFTNSSIDTSASTDPRSPTYESPLNPRLQQDLLNVSKDLENLSFESDVSAKSSDTMTSGANSSRKSGIVSPGTRIQPFREVSKPFEMADFYKYSERLRRQRSVEQQDDTASDHGSAHSSHSEKSQHSSHSAHKTMTKQPSGAPLHPLRQGQTIEDTSPVSSYYSGSQTSSNSGPYVPQFKMVHDRRSELTNRPTEPYSPGILKDDKPIIQQYECSPYKPGRGRQEYGSGDQNTVTYGIQHDKLAYHQGAAQQPVQPSPRSRRRQDPYIPPSRPNMYSQNSETPPPNQGQRSASGFNKPVNTANTNTTTNANSSNSFHLEEGGDGDGDDNESVGDAFSSEMLAWYDGNAEVNTNPPTLV